MCYTAITVKINDSNNLHRCLLVQFESHKRSNKDGFAFRYNNKVFRTLDIEKFSKELLQSEKEINNTSLVHIHLRAATSIVCNESVHLWNIGGAYCAHNGIFTNYSYYNSKLCDSYHFFRKHEKIIASKDVNGMARILEKENGYAVLTMTYSDNSFMVASLNKPVVVQYIKELGVMVFESAMTNYSDMISITKKEAMTIKGLNLVATKQKVIYPSVKRYTPYVNEYLNTVMLFNSNFDLVKRVNFFPARNMTGYLPSFYLQGKINPEDE